MKFLSAQTFQCDITVQGATTLGSTIYLTGLTNASTWDWIPVGSNTGNQLYYRTYSQIISDITAGIGLSGYVPTSRTLTINGTTYDLTANRSWTISTVDYTSRLQHQVKAGVAINKGQAVYVTSADGTNMIVGLASNASEATSSKTMGLLDATVAINGFANVVTEGLLAGLDTSSAGAEGDPVWLGTGGNLIYGLANKPYAPAHLVFIGIVTRKNNSNGEIFVKVQNGFELNEIHDVDLKTTVPVNGHILGFDGTLWVNKTIAGWLGYTPVSGTGTTNYLPKFTGSTSLGNSSFFDNGTTPTVYVNSQNANSRFYFSAVHPDGRINFNAVANTNDYTLLRAWHDSNQVGLGTGSSAGGGALTARGDSILIGTSGAIYFMAGTFGPNNVPYRLGISTSSTITYFSSGVSNNLTNIESNAFQFTAKSHTFYTGTTTGNQSNPNQYTPLFLSTAGNVVVGGTTDAGYKLDVNGIFRLGLAGGQLYSTAGNTLQANFGNAQFAVGNSGGESIDLSANSTGEIRFSTASVANRLVVKNSGNVLIGTGTDSGYKLDVVGTGRFSVDNITTSAPGTGFTLANNTAATSGVTQQNSPSLFFTGSAWVSGALKTYDIAIQSQPQTWDSTRMIWSKRLNGGSWIPFFGLRSDSTGQNSLFLYPVGYLKDGVGQNHSQGFAIANGSQATSSVQQFSPSFVVQGYGWNGTASTYISSSWLLAPEAGTSNYLGVSKFVYNDSLSNELVRFEFGERLGMWINKLSLANYTTTINSYTTVTGSVTAASAIARGTYLNQTLVATANNDTLVGLDITPTFTTGAFTGVTSWGVRVGGSVFLKDDNSSIDFINQNGRLYSGGGVFTISNGAGADATDVLRFGHTNSTGTRATVIAGQIIKFQRGGFSTTVGQIFGSTGNWVVQNGGTFTDAGYRLDVNGTTRFIGDSYISTGDFLLDNNRPIRWKDSGGTSRRAMLITAANDFQFGPVDTGWAGNTYIKAGTSMQFLVNGASGTFASAVTINTLANVGIGTTSPTSKLHVSGGRIEIDNGYNLESRTSTGNALVGLIGMSTNSINVGIWEGNYMNDLFLKGGNGSVYADFSQGNSKFFAVRGVAASVPTEYMRVTSTGNVGIGTASPSRKLEVQGDFYINGTNGALTTESSQSNLYFLNLTRSTTSLITAGNVGIGTATPTNALSIAGNGTINFVGASTITTPSAYGFVMNAGNVNIYHTNSGLSLQNSFWFGGGANVADNVSATQTNTNPASNGSAVFQISSTRYGFLQPRMTNTQVNAISTPATGLQVYDTTNNKNMLYNGSSWQSIATESYVTTQITNLINGAPGALDTLSELASALGNDASFATTVTNSIAGKVSKSGDTMTGDLTLKYDTSNNDGYGALTFAPGSDEFIIKASTAHGVFGRQSFGWHVAAGSAFGVYSSGWVKLFGVEGGTGNTQVFGNLTVNGTITESSSLKLKENVQTSEGNLEKIVNLRPVTYNKIGSQTTELGLIAEEVAEVYPEFVQYDENGEPVGVHYSRLTAALIGAVKELTNQVQELNKKING